MVGDTIEDRAQSARALSPVTIVTELGNYEPEKKGSRVRVRKTEEPGQWEKLPGNSKLSLLHGQNTFHLGHIKNRKLM